MSRFPILFEDGEALVIDKPAGMPVDRPKRGGTSLEDYLEDLKLNFHRPPWIVHRLDQDTSGCLLLARNPKAVKRFAQAFQNRLVEKRYVGIVAGKIEQESGTIDLALNKVSTKEEGWRMVADEAGKPSVTHWQKLTEVDGNTLVEFRPETGRTHQIRIHALAGLGIPLLGDPVYGDRNTAPRTMLHGSSITMTREGKPPVSATSPMPEDFRALGFADEGGASDG